VLLLGAAWIPVQALMLFETEVMRAGQRFGAASAWLSTRAVLAWGAGVAAADAFGATPSVAVQLGASTLVLALLLGRSPWPRLTQSHRDELRVVGRPITRQGVASYALGYADRYVVQGLRGPEAVGLYSVGYTLGQGVVEVVMTPVTAALSPRIIREVSQDGSATARRTAVRAALVMVGLAVLSAVGVVIAHALDLFDLIAPDESSVDRLAMVTLLVAVATALQGVVRIAYAVLLAHKATDAAASSFLVTLAVAAVVVPALTALWGVVGAALATLLATALLGALMTWHARRRMSEGMAAGAVTATGVDG
jgi:O-antigen/teichoic acid export membrane protein